MNMGTSMTKRSGTLDTLKSYPAHLYDGVNLNWLVLLSVRTVEESGVALSFEHIVVAAFKLFPKKFSLLAIQSIPMQSGCTTHCGDVRTRIVSGC